MRTVDLADFSKELGDFSKITLAAQRKAVISGIQQSIPDLVAASPVDTGLYAQSWDMTYDEKSAVLGNYAPYAGVIEHGARPHKVPIGPLLAWAKRVTGSGSQPPDYDKQVWALAIGVQKKIMEKGQAPHHILENMIPTIIENIRQELKRV